LLAVSMTAAVRGYYTVHITSLIIHLKRVHKVKQWPLITLELRAQFSTLMGILVPLILVQPAVNMISVIQAPQAGPHATQTSMKK